MVPSMNGKSCGLLVTVTSDYGAQENGDQMSHHQLLHCFILLIIINGLCILMASFTSVC